MKEKSMQRSGTEASRTHIQPSKPKREITKITNSQNTKRTYGQPSEQLFPQRWSFSNPNRTKTMNTRKGKHNRNSDTKNRQQRTTTKLPPWNQWTSVIKLLLSYQILIYSIIQNSYNTVTEGEVARVKLV